MATHCREGTSRIFHGGKKEVEKAYLSLTAYFWIDYAAHMLTVKHNVKTSFIIFKK